MRVKWEGVSCLSWLRKKSCLFIMRFSEFIRLNVDAIASEWAAVGKPTPPGERLSIQDRIGQCKAMLARIAADMEGGGGSEQSCESGLGGVEPREGDRAAGGYGAARQREGLDLAQVAMEFRALRTNVLERWRRCPGRDLDVGDAVQSQRFNEGVDQALAESIDGYCANAGSSRDMLLGALGHGLRGPLMAISLSGRSLSKPGMPDDARARAGGNIERAVKEMSRLIADLLDYTSARVGPGIAVDPSRCDLGAICRLGFEDARAIHPERAFALRMPEELWWWCDGARVAQALANLLDNAARCGDAGTPVTLSACRAGLEAVLCVHNHCDPISEGDQRCMFDPMELPAASAARDGRERASVGLGLYIAREIAASHGGRLWVESAASGTSFSIALPPGPPATEPSVG